MKQMFVALISALFLLGISPAFASADMEPTFGNTVVVKTGDVTMKYYFNADNTFTADTPDGTISGTWAVKGDEICLTPEGGEESCGPLAKGKKVGDTWTQENPDGSTSEVSIVAGR